MDEVGDGGPLGGAVAQDVKEDDGRPIELVRWTRYTSSRVDGGGWVRKVPSTSFGGRYGDVYNCEVRRNEDDPGPFAIVSDWPSEVSKDIEQVNDEGRSESLEGGRSWRA